MTLIIFPGDIWEHMANINQRKWSRYVDNIESAAGYTSPEVHC